jgi:sugar O-acyltransferase (sialic acid O-acetyltransferase NeuD family)
MSSISDAVIFGAGGHAKVIADIFSSSKKTKVIYFVDDQKQGQKLGEIPIISERDFFDKKVCLNGVLGIGDNSIREKVALKIKNIIPEFNFMTAIHHTSYIASDVEVSEGSVVMANSTINPSTKIGAHCIINTNASVDHDCIIHDFASIAPNCCLGGNCTVGRSSAVSISATLIHKINIGEHTIIGSGSLVTKNINSFVVAYGVPAKVIRQRIKGEKYL